MGSRVICLFFSVWIVYVSVYALRGKTVGFVFISFFFVSFMIGSWLCINVVKFSRKIHYYYWPRNGILMSAKNTREYSEPILILRRTVTTGDCGDDRKEADGSPVCKTKKKSAQKWITTQKKRWNSTHNYLEAARIHKKKKNNKMTKPNRTEPKRRRGKNLAVIKPIHFIAFFLWFYFTKLYILFGFRIVSVRFIRRQFARTHISRALALLFMVPHFY